MNREQGRKALKDYEIMHNVHFHGYNVQFNVPEQVWQCDSLDKTHKCTSYSLETLVNNFPYIIKRPK